MNKKWTKTVLAVLLAATLTGCAGTGTSGAASNSVGSDSVGESSSLGSALPDSSAGSVPEIPEETVVKNENYEIYLKNGYQALFADPYFKNGVTAKNAEGNDSGELRFLETGKSPSWTFSQWGSKYDILDYHNRVYGEGGTVFTYHSKGEKLGGEYVPAKILCINSNDASVYMELNAEVEYDEPRKSNEGWPHTLLSQDFGSNLIRVSELEELVMSIDYKVTKCEDKMNGQANPSLHCGQLVWYITLQNRTKGSAGYGEYVWFGLQLWDNRSQGKKVNEYAAEDAGKEDATHAFIYNPAGEKFLKNGVQPVVGERSKIDFNVIETAKNALKTAKERGFLPNTTWEDLYVGGMNFGFEVTGTYNVGAWIYSVGVYHK